MLPFVHETRPLPGRPWSVACVCDAAGSGVLAGFTNGLHDLGLPELALRATADADPPTDAPTPAPIDAPAGTATPPGGRRRLGHRTLGVLLDALADRLVGGDVVPGGDLSLPASRLAFEVRVGPFTVAADLAPEGLVLVERGAGTGLPADRLVLPLTWSPAPQDRERDEALASLRVFAPGLLDPVVAVLRAEAAKGPAALAHAVVAVTARTVDGTADLRGHVLARGGRPGDVPVRWRTGIAVPDRFGPLGPLVVARAEQLLTADTLLRRAVADLAVDAGDEHPLDVLRRAAALAPATGRAEVPDALASAARDVTDLLLQPPDLLPPASDLARAVRALVELHVHALLAAEAFADTLPPRRVALARSTWLDAVEGWTGGQTGGQADGQAGG